jgi:hypothetical protein
MTPSPASGKLGFRYEPAQTPVLAWLDRRDFARARLASPAFSIWVNHSEFAAERDALFVGYGAAGVTAKRQRVPFEAFRQWVRLIGAPFDIDGLDEFAAHWRWRVDHPAAAVMGRFGAPGDPERNAIDAGGTQCVRIRPEVYVRWRDDYERTQLLSGPGLDDYAAHVVECCLASPRRARRPAVSAS